MIDYDIPGFMSRYDLEIISNIAKNVPDNGKILEIGSWFGRTTKCLYQSKKENVDLTVCDSWSFLPENAEGDAGCGGGNKDLFEDAKKQAIKHNSTRYAFKHCLGEIYDDINIIHEDSMDYKFEEVYDSVFIDGDHTYEGVLNDITKHIKNEKTLLVGDDFKFVGWNDFLGLAKAVLETHKEYNRTLIIPGDEKSKMWIMVPSSGYWKNFTLGDENNE